jgi:molybdopterin/thiamine biosynthesis adenylyltransferase
VGGKQNILKRADRYSRVRLVRGIDLNAVQSSRICIIGAGALGNEVAKNLMLYAPSLITVVDRDSVETTNLGRCFLFSIADADESRSKAEALRSRAAEINPDCNLRAMHTDAEKLDHHFFSGYSLVIGCVDSVKTRLHINANCFFAGTPYIDGGIDGLNGRVQVVMPPEGACYECTLNGSHMSAVDRTYTCTGREANVHSRHIGSEPSVPGIIGSIQSLEAIKILSGLRKKGVLMMFNGLTTSIDEIIMEVNPDCQNHGRVWQ